jgi:cytoskeletal protein RodZ
MPIVISRVVGFLTASVAIAALAAGCGTSKPTHAVADTSVSAAAAAPSPSPSTAIRSLAPVAKLTGACPLLSTDELKVLLGGSSKTKLTASEEKPEVKPHSTTYNCDYGSNGDYPFVLGVQTATAGTPAELVNAVASAAGVKTQKVTGVGSAGVFYQTKTVSLLAVAKTSHGQTRTIFFVAPVIVPEQKCVDVAKVVIARI